MSNLTANPKQPKKAFMWNFYNLRGTKTFLISSVCSSSSSWDWKETLPSYWKKKISLLEIVNFISVRLFSSVLQRCRRSSKHWHKCDPRAAVTDGLSSVGKHMRFISTVWREIQDFSSLFCLFAHSPFLSDVFFPHIDHLFPMFSRMLKLGMRYRRGWWQTKKNRNILNLLLQANVSPMFHIWTFPHSNLSRLTCRCSPSHLLVVAVEKCLTTNRICSVSEKWVLDSTVATSKRRITPCRRHPTFLSL